MCPPDDARSTYKVLKAMHGCVKHTCMHCSVCFHLPSKSSRRCFGKAFILRAFWAGTCLRPWQGAASLWTPASHEPRSPSCLSYSRTQSAAAEAWSTSSFVTLGRHLCYFRIMLFWLHWSMTGKLQGAQILFFFFSSCHLLTFAFGISTGA